MLPSRGRRIDAEPHEVVDIEDPDRVVKLNAGWIRLATEYGLLNDEREFLLGVDYAEEGADWPEMAWVKVQLLDVWIIAGCTVRALGSSIAPDFSALSLDGQALMRTTLWGDGRVSSLVIPKPSTVSLFRERAAHGA